MRPPPKLTEFFRYPIVSGTALLAVGATAAWAAGLDVSRLFVSPMIRRGELWRLVTSMFPHVGLMHLIFNLYWIWVFGTLVEQVYGSAKTMALILLFAVGSNALEYAFATGGVGLSGVGYGLFGLLWVLSRHDERFREAVDTRTIQLFVGWFFLCIFLTYAQIMNVGNIAHGSGAVLGFLTGSAISLREHRPFMAGLTAVVVCFGLWGATVGRPGVNLSKWGGNEECGLGYDALNSNHNDEALRWLTESVRYKHIEPGCWTDLGIAYQRVSRNSDALVAYRKAAEMGDEGGEYGLGLMYERGEGVPKDAQEALKWYRKAAEHGSPVILNDVAWVYATSPDPAIHNPAEALKYATRAVAADKQHPNANFLDTLAEAQYANGNYDAAIKTEQQAITLASEDQKETFNKNLAKYQLAAQKTTNSKKM